MRGTAIAEIHRAPVDLVLAELRMAPISGVELTRLIRDEAMLQGHAGDPHHRQEATARGAVDGFAAGADDVVAKPFHFEVLAARIARRIARARSVKELRRDNATLDARVVTRAIELGEMRGARWSRARPSGCGSQRLDQPRLSPDIPRSLGRGRRRSSAMAKLASTKPALSPQSWRTASTLTRVERLLADQLGHARRSAGFRRRRRARPRSRTSMTSGWRM